MSEELLRAVLETAEARADKNDPEGWTTLPEGRTLTLHVAHAGVQLTVSKIEAVRVAQGIVRARSTKGETHLLGLADLFAAALDGSAGSASLRKAGFLER